MMWQTRRRLTVTPDLPGDAFILREPYRPSLAAMALTFERISAPLVLRRRPPSGACGSRACAPGSGSARAWVVRGARRASRVYRLDPPLHGALAEAALVHGLALGLSGAVEVDYLPLELVGEMPRVPGVPHMRSSRLLRPSRNCPHQCCQSIRRRPTGGPSGLARIVGNAPNAYHRNLSMVYFRLLWALFDNARIGHCNMQFFDSLCIYAR